MKITSLFLLLSSLVIVIFACNREPYLIGEIEEVTRNEMVLSIIENNSKIDTTNKVVITQKKLMDFSFFKKGSKVKVWIYDQEVRHSTPSEVPLKDIELIE